MVKFIENKKENLIAAKIEGKISAEEVEQFHPIIHRILESNDEVDFYFDLQEFEGYDLEAIWADLKIDAAHLSDYGDIAIVGDNRWQKMAAKATDIFTSSDVKFFEPEEKDAAKNWIGLN